LPPSRGKWKAGAFWPSARAFDDRAFDDRAFGDKDFADNDFAETADATAAGLEALSEDFNRFDAALCDASLAAALLDLLADAGCVFAPRVCVDARVFRGFFLAVELPEGVLDDFFRDFWDIRLPFVAFGGSTKAVLQLSSGVPDSRLRLGNFGGDGVWLQGIPRTTPLLVERAPGAK
jgi:hypothetical protein